MMPGPPALVTMPTRRPAGRGWRDRARAGVEEVLDGVGAQYAAVLEDRGDGHVGAGQRAGVAGGGARALGGAAGLDHQDRLLARDALGELGEAARIAERLEVHRDDAGGRIVLQRISRSLPETSALLPIEANSLMPTPSASATLRMATRARPTG